MWPPLVARVVGTGILAAAVAGCGPDESPVRPQNTAPTACFHLIPESVPIHTSFAVDARCSSDAQDDARALLMRWDWEADGTWDTGFAASTASAHQYATAGVKTIRLEVKDTGGSRDTTTRTITITAVSEFVLIPPGTFLMGSPPDEPCRAPDEEQHAVTLTRGFYVSTTEVTQAQWTSVMHWNSSYTYGPNLPVERITWFDAIRYCNERSTREALAPAYAIADPVYDRDHVIGATVTWDREASGYRLPTEAEWEYACRAGSVTAFPNGGISTCTGSDLNLERLGWYLRNSSRQTHDVELKEPNAWDLHDMHGNVSAWCWDLYGSYTGPATDPAGADSSLFRVTRGGSWNLDAQNCRSAARGFREPQLMPYEIGLRVARNAP